MLRFAASSPPDRLHTHGMTDVSILTPSRSAVDPIDFPAIEDSCFADRRDPRPLWRTRSVRSPGCGVRTPELWLLNWWTWLFPLLTNRTRATNASVVIYAMPGFRSCPIRMKARTSCRHWAVPNEDGASGPPDVGETILHAVNMGNGLIDLTLSHLDHRGDLNGRP